MPESFSFSTGKQGLRTRSFQNKIIYVLCIAILMFPMFWLCQPSSVGTDGERGTPGGKLEQLRAASRISVEDVGEVSLTSETLRLGTFGLDGVATMILWNKADTFKKKKDWTNLSATLKQLILLVPHFETVWRFQGWNLAYNVSVECDDYRDRYAWIIEGIRYLQRGVKYNQRSIRLTWDVGWTAAQKISRSDEKKEFRILYRNDNDFNKDVPLDQRDSWLTAREWYKKAENLHVIKGVDLGTISPTLFFSHRPNAGAYYAENLETDGYFDSKALLAWQTFQEEWTEFGNREIPTVSGELIRLAEEEKLKKQNEMLLKELTDLQPGLKEKMIEEKRKNLTEEERRVLDIPETQRTADEYNLASDAKAKVEVTYSEWAARLPAELRMRGSEIAKKLETDELTAMLINRYRQIVNYKFWKLRGLMEPLSEVINARKMIYDANAAFKNGDLVSAKDNYDKAFSIWADVISRPQFVEITEEELMGSDLRELIDQYEIILNQLNETLPKDFILQDVIKKTRPTDPVILIRGKQLNKPYTPVE